MELAGLLAPCRGTRLQLSTHSGRTDAENRAPLRLRQLDLRLAAHGISREGDKLLVRQLAMAQAASVDGATIDSATVSSMKKHRRFFRLVGRRANGATTFPLRRFEKSFRATGGMPLEICEFLLFGRDGRHEAAFPNF